MRAMIEQGAGSHRHTHSHLPCLPSLLQSCVLFFLVPIVLVCACWYSRIRAVLRPKIVQCVGKESSWWPSRLRSASSCCAGEVRCPTFWLPGKQT